MFFFLVAEQMKNSGEADVSNDEEDFLDYDDISITAGGKNLIYYSQTKRSFSINSLLCCFNYEILLNILF